MLCQTARALAQWVVCLPRGQRRPLARDDALLRAVERSAALAALFGQLVHYHNADAWVKRLASSILAAYEDYNALQPKAVAATRGGWRALTAYLAERSTLDDALDYGRRFQSHIQRFAHAMRISLYGDPAALFLAHAFIKRCTWDTRLLALAEQVMNWHDALRRRILPALPASAVLYQHMLVLADEAQTVTQRHIVRVGLRHLRRLGQLPTGYEHDDVERAAAVSFCMPNGDPLCVTLGACRTDQWRFLGRQAFWHSGHPKRLWLERVWRDAAKHGSLRCILIFLRHWGPSILEYVSLSMLSAEDVYREDRLRRIAQTADFLCAIAHGRCSPFAPPKLLHIRASRGLTACICQRMQTPAQKRIKLDANPPSTRACMSA